MCGIAGEMRFNQAARTRGVSRMLDDLTSRGPDNGGVYQTAGICLGHRRLKIIDLSKHADQPMVDPVLGLALVFNGCIYNYRALRRQLEELGHQFFSHSDSEVILKAFAEWGDSCLQKFNGMFAFAIYQRDSGELFVARDRLGIKPLYYSLDSESLKFASTLPALMNAYPLSTELDSAALNHYISFRAIVGNKTLFKSVRKLEPATWMRVSADGRVRTQRYWRLQNGGGEAAEADEAVWSERLEAALFNSVQRRLEADVPVGVLLSGGLDSSLLVGLLSYLGQTDLHTFSIGFDQVAREEGDEFHYSDIIAKHYKTSHCKIFAEHEILLDSLRDCVLAMAEPMVSHDVIGFYLLSQAVSRHVRVVQSGQGADEVFGGYHWYPPMIGEDPNSAAQSYAKNYFSWSFAEYRQLMAPEFTAGDQALAFVEDYFRNSAATSAIDKTLLLDTEVMLVDDPVKRVDNMTMAFGLEARVPFLDHELVELAFQMPHQLKVRDGGKYLLRQVARKHIPSEVIDRPKGYFPVPALRNMQDEYLSLAREVFHQPAARERGIFNRAYIDRMLAAPQDFRTAFGSKLWQVTLLELWLQEHGIS